MKIAPDQTIVPSAFLVSFYYYLVADAEEHWYATGVSSSEQVSHISSLFL